MIVQCVLYFKVRMEMAARSSHGLVKELTASGLTAHKWDSDEH